MADAKEDLTQFTGGLFVFDDDGKVLVSLRWVKEQLQTTGEGTPAPADSFYEHCLGQVQITSALFQMSICLFEAIKDDIPTLPPESSEIPEEWVEQIKELAEGVALTKEEHLKKIKKLQELIEKYSKHPELARHLDGDEVSQKQLVPILEHFFKARVGFPPTNYLGDISKPPDYSEEELS